MTDTTNNTFESIAKSKDGSATELQGNFLLSLYKEELRKSVLKSQDNIKLDKSRDYINFNKPYGNRIKGSFGMHLMSTFIPLNKEYTKIKVSNMINDAKNNKKFDKKFIKAFLKSKNDYVKPEVA
tara:strand:- start:1185 stop:1559 length:375 start_codon:yes stop_codon:yes gene_type:complete